MLKILSFIFKTFGAECSLENHPDNQKKDTKFYDILPLDVFTVIDRHSQHCIEQKIIDKDFRMYEKTIADAKIRGVRICSGRTVYCYKTKDGEYAIKREEKKSLETREIWMVENLQHQNIVKTFATKIFKRNKKELYVCWIIMEYLPFRIASSRFTYLNEKHKENIKIILKDVLMALEYMHEIMEIAHLDIKTTNVAGKFEGGRIKYKLIDFGLSSKINCKKTGNIYKKYGKLEFVCGTFPFVPPEIYRSKIFGLKSDIYCLGLLTWCICLGRTNLSYDECTCIKIKSFLDSKEKRLNLTKIFDEELNEFVEKCTAKKIRDRPTARELLNLPMFLEK